jgi:type IV secretion system protein VirB11
MSTTGTLLTHALAPLAPYLAAEDVTEIIANPDGQIWIERHGAGLQAVETMPAAARGLLIRLVAGSQGLVCHAEVPTLAAVLPSGHRFQGFVPPVVTAPSFVIRSHQVRVLRRDDYLGAGLCTAATWGTICQALATRKNLLIVGGTGSGKTTFLNSLLAEIDPRQRLLSIEDTPELRVTLPNHHALYTSAALSMAAAVKVALRSRPDRIIPGEIRDGQTAIAVLSAWGSGHPGGLCTFHADDAGEALPRLEELCAEVSPGHYGPRIGRTIDMVIGLTRDEGTRMRAITSFVQVDGYKEGQYVWTDVVEAEPGAVRGRRGCAGVEHRNGARRRDDT